MSVLPSDVAKLVQNMGRSCAPAFQAHIVEVNTENQLGGQNEDPKQIAEAAEIDAEGSKFLDNEASNAAKELGKQAAQQFQARLATMAHEAVWSDRQAGVVSEPADAPFVESETQGEEAAAPTTAAASVEPSATPAGSTRTQTRSGSSPKQAKELFTPSEVMGSEKKATTGDKRVRGGDMPPPAETKRRRVEDVEEPEAAPVVSAN